MLDCEIGLAGIYPENTARNPSAGVARVERERPVHQPNHRTDILAEKSQHKGGVGENAWVVLPHFERLPRKIDAFAAGYLRVFGPAVFDAPHMAKRRPGKCRPVMAIDRDCLL